MNFLSSWSFVWCKYNDIIHRHRFLCQNLTISASWIILDLLWLRRTYVSAAEKLFDNQVDRYKSFKMDCSYVPLGKWRWTDLSHSFDIVNLICRRCIRRTIFSRIANSEEDEKLETFHRHNHKKESTDHQNWTRTEQGQGHKCRRQLAQ